MGQNENTKLANRHYCPYASRISLKTRNFFMSNQFLLQLYTGTMKNASTLLLLTLEGVADCNMRRISYYHSVLQYKRNIHNLCNKNIFDV